MTPPPPFQPTIEFRHELPRTLRETHADALKGAERVYRDAQAALNLDVSNENRARYAKALYDYDQFQGMFPFVAAGLAGDAKGLRSNYAVGHELWEAENSAREQGERG